MVKENFGQTSGSLKICDKDCLKNFLLHYFVPSLRDATFESSHFVAEIYFIFVFTLPLLYLYLCIFVCAPVKRSEKLLLSKTNFITSLQISFSNFRLRLC